MGQVVLTEATVGADGSLKENPKASRQQEVLRLLGPPDATWGGTKDEPEVTWCYGSTGRDVFSTLGRVVFSEQGRAEVSYGAMPGVIPEELVSENELEAMLRLVHSLPDPIAPGRWDPSAAVQVRNRLASQSAKKAFFILREYIRITSPRLAPERYGAAPRALFPLCRLLYGASDLQSPEDSPFPIAEVEGLPFLLLRTRGASGPSGFKMDDLRAYWGQVGNDRRSVVPGSLHPRIIDKLLQGYAALKLPPEVDKDNRIYAQQQMILMAERVMPARAASSLLVGAHENRWAGVSKWLQEHPVDWDESRQRYGVRGEFNR